MEMAMEKALGVPRASSHDSSSGCSDSDPEESSAQVDDAMLGSLQRGLKSISTHAKAYMDTCKTDENRNNMKNKLESSMLGLLKSEQVVKELPLLVTEVVDKFVDDMDEEEEEEENDKPAVGPLPCFKPLLQLNEVKMGEMSRQIFQFFKEYFSLNKMSLMPTQIFDQKVKDFESSLTEEKLKQLPKFTALEAQVAMSVDETERNKTGIAVGGGDADLGLDYWNKEVKYHDPDELSDDELMLPTIDPISKEPMMNPVRNKYCNHVFEERTVLSYINADPNPRCPLEYCRNEKSFGPDDFVKVPKLTEQVRRKNMKIGGNMEAQII